MTATTNNKTQNLSPEFQSGIKMALTNDPFAELTEMTNESRQDWLRAISPTNLRYLSAIRGFVPADQVNGFTYAMLGCKSGALLVALAAANPEGQFFGFGASEDELAQGSAQAVACGIDNVKFVAASPEDLAAALPGQFDFVVTNLVSASELDATRIIAAAAAMLKDTGLCYTAYNVTPSTSKTTNDFLLSYQAGSTNTDQAQDAARKHGLSYLGSAKLRNNYLELSAPAETHDSLLAQQGAAVYENLKDVAMNVSVRHDVFSKGNLGAGTEAARLGGFTFGLPTPTGAVETQFSYFGRKVDLSTPLYTRLLTALADMPHSIGDLVAEPAFTGIAQEEIVAAVQLLCAAGIAEPTRDFGEMLQGDFNNLHFVGDYNRRLRDETVSEQGALLASPTLGRALLGSAPMVMTLQALDAGGLQGAEEILDGMLLNAPDSVKAQIPADLADKETRRNTAYRLLEQACKDWLLFCCVNGILKPSTH